MLELERPSFDHAPRQRDAQHFVKRQMDDQSTENRYRNGQAPRRAERAHPHREDQDPGDVKAERVREQDVGNEAREYRGNRAARARSLQPVRHREERRALTPGNHAGPNFWPGMAGNPWVCQRMTAASATSAAPVSASLSFILPTLLP